jgi:hypothetical protein
VTTGTAAALEAKESSMLTDITVTIDDDVDWADMRSAWIHAAETAGFTIETAGSDDAGRPLVEHDGTTYVLDHYYKHPERWVVIARQPPYLRVEIMASNGKEISDESVQTWGITDGRDAFIYQVPYNEDDTINDAIDRFRESGALPEGETEVVDEEDTSDVFFAVEGHGRYIVEITG